MSSRRGTLLISLLLVLVCFGSNWQVVSARVSAIEGSLDEGLEAGVHGGRLLHQILGTAAEEGFEDLDDSLVEDGSAAVLTESTQSMPASGSKEEYNEEEPLNAQEEVDDYEDAGVLPGEVGEEGEEDYSDFTQPDPVNILDDEAIGLGSSSDPLALPIAAHMGAEAVEEAKGKNTPIEAAKQSESAAGTAALSKPANASHSTSQLVDTRGTGKQGVPGNSSSVGAVTIPSMGGTSYSAEAIETNNQGKTIQDPMPGSHSSMSSKGMSTEKSGSATASEGSMLTSLAQNDKPVTSHDLDSSLAAEMATETSRLEESGEPKPKRTSAKSGSAAAGLQTQGTGDAASLNDSKDEGAWAEPEEEPAVSTVELGSFGDNLQSRSQASSSIQQQDAAGLPGNTASLDATAGGADAGRKPATASNSSLLAQGAILGSAVRDMVSNNASNFNGTAAVILATIAGTAVACIGICLYRRCRQGKGKPSPRIIEIGNLTRGSKSPSYSRVNRLNKEQRSSGSGSKWEDWDSDSWETLDSARNLQHKTKEKGKKAWEWDNDF